jgi:hypothetical protein
MRLNILAFIAPFDEINIISSVSGAALSQSEMEKIFEGGCVYDGI